MLKLCSSLEDYSNLFNSSKNIVCFGAGRYSKHLSDLDSKIKCLDKINYFIDNNEQKKNLKIANKEFKVYPFDKLKELESENSIVLISVLDYSDVLEQIEKSLKNNKVKICLLYHVFGLYCEDRANSKTIPLNIRILDTPVIPKKIHYCWFGGNSIPEKYKEWIATWRKFCPDYEIIEWNENDYDITKNEYMYQAYKAKKMGFVSDYARLDIIYNEGGIYLDTDVELVANLDDLLYQKAFAGFEYSNRVAFGLGFGAAKGNSLIKELRDYYNGFCFVNPDGSLNLKTCPEYQTECLSMKGLKQNGEYQIVEGMTIYPEKVLTGMSGATRRIMLADYTRAVHHYEGSWVPENQRQRLAALRKIFTDVSYDLRFK